MIPKTPVNKKSNLRKGVKFFLITELVLIGGSYLFVAACNRSQETRKLLYGNRFTWYILQFYYDIAEKAGNNQVRNFDRATWAAQNYPQRKGD